MTGVLRIVAYQLPARWDGRDVEWRAWERTDEVFVCPPKPRPPCVQCRSTAAPMMNTGIVRPPATPGVVNLRHSIASLSAFRCPDCSLDTIWDRDTDDWWTLEPADYGPQGSDDPRLPIGGVAASISCRDLWYRDGAWASTLLRGTLRVDGRLIVTDRALAIYLSELDGCTDMPAPAGMTRDQVFTAARLLLTPWVDEAPTREFDTRYLDHLEFAGYVIRPLLGHWWHAHAVVNPAGAVVGVLMPWSLHGDPAPEGTTRKVAA